MGGQKVLLDGIEEAREYGGNATEYDHDPSRVDGLLAQTTTAGKGYFITDALGSVYAVVDSTGAEVSKYAYDVYGARTATAEGMATPWGFTGRRHDSSTEMYYRVRYLDGERAVFAAADPLWTDALSKQWMMRGTGDLPRVEIRPYSYVNGKPSALLDPTGMEPDFSRKCTQEIRDAYQRAVGMTKKAVFEYSKCCLPSTWSYFDVVDLWRFMNYTLTYIACDDGYIETVDGSRACAGSNIGDTLIQITTRPCQSAVGTSCKEGSLLHEGAHLVLGEREHAPLPMGRVWAVSNCACNMGSL